jgi:hypothetical protein
MLLQRFGIGDGAGPGMTSGPNGTAAFSNAVARLAVDDTSARTGQLLHLETDRPQ